MPKITISLLDFFARKSIDFNSWAKTTPNWEFVAQFCRDVGVEPPEKSVWENWIGDSCLFIY